MRLVAPSVWELSAVARRWCRALLVVRRYNGLVINVETVAATADWPQQRKQ